MPLDHRAHSGLVPFCRRSGGEIGRRKGGVRRGAASGAVAMRESRGQRSRCCTRHGPCAWRGGDAIAGSAGGEMAERRGSMAERLVRHGAADGVRMDTYHWGYVARHVAARAVPRSHVARGQGWRPARHAWNDKPT